MASGINISLVANVRDFIRGTRDASDSLDDVGDSLDDLTRESGDTERDVTRDLTEISRDAEDAADKMERSFRDAFRDVEKHSKDSGRDVARNTKRATDDSADYTGEFRDEARSNFSEVTSSFDGSMESIADLAQGTFGGLAGSLAGPFGIAAGVVAAAGGLFYNSWKENAEKTEQRVQDMYDDMIASGNEFLTREFINQAISDIVSGSEDARVSMERVREVASMTGLSERSVLAAYAGDASALAEAAQVAQDGWEDADQAIQDARDSGAFVGDNSALTQRKEAWRALREEIGDVGDETDDARSKAQLYEDTVRMLDNRDTERVQEGWDNLSGAVGRTSQAVKDVPNTKTVKLGLDSGELERQISALERRRITLRVDPKLTSYGRSIA